VVAGGSTIWRDEMTQTARKFPFPVQKRPAIEVDPSMLAVEHGVEPPAWRSNVESKYDAVFKQLKPGSCVKCEPSEVTKIAGALRKNLTQKKFKALIGCKVMSRERCDDGHGRVWAIAKEQA
jgi:hypothetical protein